MVISGKRVDACRIYPWVQVTFLARRLENQSIQNNTRLKQSTIAQKSVQKIRPEV